MEELNYPLISVIMITYNQEEFIAEAIRGVLSQKYKGSIELIIGNDNSFDGTDSVVRKLIKNEHNGAWIKYSNHKINKGVIGNFIWALNTIKGKYIAICEGDDYWIDQLKLQKQIDFLEQHQEYSMCFHGVKTKNYSKNYKKEFAAIENRAYTINEVYNSWLVPTASIIFKSEVLSSLLQNRENDRILNPDIILILTCFSYGKVRGIADQMSIYRFQENGISIDRMKKNK